MKDCPELETIFLSKHRGRYGDNICFTFKIRNLARKKISDAFWHSDCAVVRDKQKTRSASPKVQASHETATQRCVRRMPMRLVINKRSEAYQVVVLVSR
jgi:hypothetical protein